MFKRLLKLPPNYSFFLFGPRNTGKSTSIKECFPDALFIDLLDPLNVRKYMHNPNILRDIVGATKKTHIVLDEVQKVPELLDVVHYLIETTNKKFILTGSSARKLKRGGANLLAGRAFVYNLFPLSALELNTTFDLHCAMSYGLLPKIYNNEKDFNNIEFLHAYANTYLKEEILEEQVIRQIEPFQKFLEVAAQMNGEILNIHKIAMDVRVDDKTILQYFQILEDTMLGFLMYGYQHSVRKRLISKPKFYFFDTGIKRALEQTLESNIRKGTYGYGKAFEHFLVLECQKLISYSRKQFKMSYFMTQEGVEIDLVVERPGKPLLFIEIKSKTDVEERDIKELRWIRKDLPEAEYVCFSQDKYPKLIDGILVLPWQEGLEKYFWQKEEKCDDISA